MVVVLANMANVPVMLGKEVVATTNAAGVAHVPLEFPAKEVFELNLDTSSNELLRPVNPQFPFVMPGHDEVFVVQESFRLLPAPKVVIKKKQKRKRRKKRTIKKEVVVEKRHRPTQIGGSAKQWDTVRKPKRK